MVVLLGPQDRARRRSGASQARTSPGRPGAAPGTGATLEEGGLGTRRGLGLTGRDEAGDLAGWVGDDKGDFRTTLARRFAVGFRLPLRLGSWTRTRSFRPVTHSSRGWR